MRANVASPPSNAGSPTASYSWAIVRIVPRVERGEFINVGAIVFARALNFLDARVELDTARLLCLAPEVDLALVERHLRLFCAVCAGEPEGGPMAAAPAPERFHWLTAPRSTVIQTSPAHVGLTNDPNRALEELLVTHVRQPDGWW